MKHNARNIISESVEIVQITTAGPHESLCPQCKTSVRTTGQFFGGINIGESLYAPVCAPCVTTSYPTLGAAIEALNTAAKCLEQLEWRHAKQALGALQLVAKHVASTAGPRGARTEDEIAKDLRRAFVAVVARHVHGVTEATTADLVGNVNLFDLVDMLAAYIARRLKDDGDAEDWLSSASRDIEGGGRP